MAKKYENIKIPKDVKSMGLDKIAFFTEFAKYKDKDPNVAEIKYMCHLFTGIPEKTLGRYTTKARMKLFNQIVKCCAVHIPEPLPLHLRYPNPLYKEEEAKLYREEGREYPIPEIQVYTFRNDFTKLPTDWFIDVDQADLEEEPEAMAAFCYVEDGMEYGEPPGS